MVYYRICVITKNKDRFVSHVVTINNESQGLQSIKVTAEYREDVEAVDVKWTQYTGEGFESYRVFHAVPGSGGGIKGDLSIKCEPTEWEEIAEINSQDITTYSDYDYFEPGTNLYKVVVELEGGRKIESNTATVRVPSEDGGDNGDTGTGFKVMFKSSPEGIVDCCNCSISFSWEAEGGSGDYRYQYQLAGYETRWSDWGNTTSATYENLPQGSYTFMVICEDVGKHKVAVAQNTFTVRCAQEGNGTIPTPDISLYEYESNLFGRKAVDLNIATKAGTQRHVVDIYFGLIYPTGHFRCLIINDSGIVLGDKDALQPLLKNVEMFDINDPITLYTYIIPDDAPKGEYLWVVLFTDSTKTFFNPDWIVSYDMASFNVE
jgi:hypothetical protein